MATSVRTALDLGLFIRDRRRHLGLNQQMLAERVGVSRQWIVEVEHGKARAEVGLVLRTLMALGISLQAHTDAEPVEPGPLPVVDIDAIIERARSRPF